MFSLRLPISVKNTLTPIPKPHVFSPYYPRSQTLPFPSLLPIPKLRATLPTPNVAVSKELHGEPDDRAAIFGSLPEPEPFPPELLPELMPKHVAMIMDGNSRWAKMQGFSPSEGHEAGARTLIRMIELCRSWGVKVLTVFVFSNDNWNRSKVEIDFLMNLTERIINVETENFKRDGVRLSIIGDISKLPSSLQRTIHNGEESTKESSKLQLIMALNYSGKYDVVQACKMVAKKVKDDEVELEDINESLIEQELETNFTEFPNPDLLIRTSGELRVSNFFLWQLAYTELYFEPQLWPDFGRDEFVEALASFQRRQRRFGRRHSQN